MSQIFYTKPLHVFSALKMNLFSVFSDSRRFNFLQKRLMTWQVALAFIILLAAVPRLVNLEYIPPGSDGDVAWYSINALDWIDRGVWPYYIRELYGPEPLSIYAIGLVIPFVGISHSTALIASALWNTLTVALLFPAAYWLLADESRHLRIRAGLLSALAGAISLHAIHISRSGLPPPFLPGGIALMVSVTAWARAKGGDRRWLLAGLSLALTQYIYIADRVVPLVVVLWFAYDWLRDRAGFRSRFRGWFIMGVTSFIFVLPNIYTFISTPRAFIGRAEAATPFSGALIWTFDTSKYGGPLGLVWRKLINNFLSFGVTWPSGPYTSGLSQPILTPLFFGGFLLTVWLLLRRSRQRQFAWPWLALPVVLLPDLISSLNPVPHATREVGVIAFVFLIGGIGTAYLWELMVKWKPSLRRLFIIIGLLLIFVPSAWQIYQYFFVLPDIAYADPELSWRGDQASLDISRRMVSQPQTAYLIPYTEFERSTISWITAGPFRDRHSAINTAGELQISNPPAEITVMMPADPYRVRWDGHEAKTDNRLWVLLKDGETLLLPPFTADQEQVLFQNIDSAQPEPLMDRSGQEIARFFTIQTPDDLFAARPVIDHPADATFGNELKLLGYSVPDVDITPGDTFFTTLYWQAVNRPSEDYEIFVQLWNDAGESLAQWQNVPFGAMYRTRIWLPDEIVATHQWLTVPQNIPAGRYRLIAGVFRTNHNERVDVTGDSADTTNQVAIIGDLRYPLADRSAHGTLPPWDVNFGGLLNIAGLDMTLDSVPQTPDTDWTAHAGQTLSINLDWETLQIPPLDYNIFVHLIPVDGQTPDAQADSLIRPDYPTGIWRPGDSIADTLTLALPDNLQPGAYNLWIGIYYWQNGERLSVTEDGIEQPDQRLKLARIEVK